MTQNNKKKKTKAKALKQLLGKGDYSEEIVNMSNAPRRLEAKIDHLEKVLSKKSADAKSVATSLGRSLGSLVPIPGASELGALAGSTMAKLFGHGNYVVKTNSLMSMGSNSGTTVAKFSTDKRGVRITDREYICDITSSSTAYAFNNSSFAINPSDVSTFPWLSAIAVQFQQWEPLGMVFEFVSSSSEYGGSNQALGTVVMATDYDPYDTPYTSKIIMENSDYAASAKPSMGQEHGIECDPLERPNKVLYVNTASGVPTTETTLGNFQLATSGIPNTSVVVGELWVSYDIMFYKKIVGSDFNAFYNNTGTSVLGQGLLSGPGNATQFAITLSQGSTYSTLNFNNTSSASWYIVVVEITLLNASDSLTLSPNNCTVIKQVTGGVAAAKVIAVYTVQCTHINASVQFGAKNGAGSTWSILAMYDTSSSTFGV